MKSKYLFISVFPLLTCSLVGCQNSKNKLPTVNKYKMLENVPSYYYDSDTKKFFALPSDQAAYENFYFFNGSSVPYQSLTEIVKTQVSIGDTPGAEEMYVKYKLTYDENENAVITNQQNGSYCTIDYSKQSVVIEDYSAFTSFIYGHEEPLTFLFDDKKNYFLAPSEYEISRATRKMEIDFSDYSIPLYKLDGEIYFPRLLVRNIFFELYDSPLNSIFNGTGVYYYLITNNQMSLDMAKQIRDTATIFDSEYMEFSYNSLALSLDFNYGLKEREQRSNGKIKKYLEKGAYSFLGKYHDDLVNTKNSSSIKAMYKLVADELDDGGHTGISSFDVFFDTLLTVEDIKYGAESQNTIDTKNAVMTRKQAAGVDCSSIIGRTASAAYKEVDGVAYVEFDSFVASTMAKPSSIPTEANYYNDTFLFTAYSNKQIHDHNIKNVVVDISTNGGGEASAAAFIISWLTRGKGWINLRNSYDNTFIQYHKVADVDFDGVLTDNDFLPEDTNLYCIISDYTFSCGNLLACSLKDYTDCKFIGTRTGGGSCIVKSGFTTGWGIGFQCSSFLELGRKGSTQENFVSVDPGIYADFYKIKEDNYAVFADRQYINQIIKAAN